MIPRPMIDYTAEEMASVSRDDNAPMGNSYCMPAVFWRRFFGMDYDSLDGIMVHPDNAMVRAYLRECAIRKFIAENDITDEDFQTDHWRTLFKLAHAEIAEIKSEYEFGVPEGE